MISVGSILFGTYVALGPGAWALLHLGLALGRSRMTRLRRSRATLPEPAPSVAVLIPAKDEADGIEACVSRVLDLDYPRLDVVVVNDRSKDDTGRILDELAARQAPGDLRRLRVVHIPQDGLPAGWLGKCHALYAGTRGLDSEWLLLVDSDVTVEPQALSRVLALAEQRKYDAVTLLTRLECRGFWERLILPLAAGIWAILFTISLTNEDRRKHVAYANGQFFLIRRRAYEAVGGHEAVKDQIVEDVELMKRLKAAGFKVRFFLGSELASTRMHATFRQMFHGWGRIYSGTARRKTPRLIAAMAFLLFSGLTVYPALAWGVVELLRWEEWRWLAASLVHAVLLTLHLLRVYYESGNRKRYALLFPLSGPVMVAILAFALRMCRTGRVNWRDTIFQQAAPAP